MSTNKCELKLRNTAASRCKYDWGLFCRIIVTPLKKVYTGVDENNSPITFDEWLIRGIHAAVPAERFYPMPYFSDSVSTSEDKTTWANGYGQNFVIKEGNKGLTQSYNQDFCLSNRLAGFNDGMTRRAFIFDNKKIIWGCTKNGGKAGFETDMFCTTADITQPSEISEPKIDYTFKVPGEFAEKDAVASDINVLELDGLEDVEMVAVKGTSTTEIHFYSLCGGQDITCEMAAISGENTCWLMDNVAMVNSPTYANGKFTIDNTYLTGEELKIATPDVLYQSGLLYKECTNSIML